MMMCGGEENRRRRRRRHFFFAFYERRVFAAERGGGTSVDREKRVVRVVDWRGSVVVRTPFLLAKKKEFRKEYPPRF